MINMIIKKFSNISEKNSIILKNVIFSVLIKGLSLIISLFSMPTYIRFFNDQVVLGLWFTILSILNWILAFDFGIGNGLRNKLALSITKKDYDSSKKYISSAYFSIGILCFIFILILVFLSNFIDWNSVLGISTNIVGKKYLSISLIIVFVGIVMQLFFKIITSVLYAVQKPFIINLISLIISSSTLVAVLIIPSKSNNINLVIMSVIHMILSILPYIICSLWVFFKTDLKCIRPGLKYIDKKYIKDVLFLGGNFFYIQMMYMFIISTNEVLITKLYGASSVVDYSIYYRLFSLLGTISVFLLAPIWSLVTKAIAEKDYNWLNQLFKRLLFISIILSFLEFLLIPFLQFVIDVWLGDNSIIVNYYYALVFSILGVLMIFNNVLSSIANGMGKLKVQSVCFTFGSIFKIMCSIFLVKLTSNWIYVIICTVIVLFLYCIIQYIYINRDLNQLMKNKVN